MANNPALKGFLEQIGEKLRNTRHLRSEKLATVAEGTGLSHTVLSQVENGRYLCLSFDLLFRILNYYQLDISAVL